MDFHHPRRDGTLKCSMFWAGYAGCIGVIFSREKRASGHSISYVCKAKAIRRGALVVRRELKTSASRLITSAS